MTGARVNPMAEHDSSENGNAAGPAQQAADQLALALEDAGFDVGRMFPMLRGINWGGIAAVDLGRVTEPVAVSLAGLLSRAADRGITV